MACRNLLFTLVLAGGLLGPPAPGQVADSSAGSQAPAAQPTDRLSVYIQAIQDARDPSAAVGAYARALAQAGSEAAIPPAVLEAYVHRMVQFYLPEVAYQQARMLVDANPNDGIAWGVLSYVAARHGQMAEALADTAQAASRMPDNRFVQETVGEVFAWYDLNKPAVSDSLRESIEKIRSQMQNQESFAAAYQNAASELKREQGSQTATATRPAAMRPAGQQAYELPEGNYAEPLPQPLYAPVALAPEEYSYGYPQGDYYYPSLVYTSPYCAPDWCWWNEWWPYGPFWPFFGGGSVDRDDSDNHHGLFRLSRDGVGLLFLQQHGKFALIGFDHSPTTRWLDHTARVSVSRDSAMSSARDGNQSRIFAPGHVAGHLTFAHPSGIALALRQGAGSTSVDRSVWSGVPRNVTQQDGLRPTAVSPNVVQGQRTNVSRLFGSSRSAAAGDNMAHRLTGPEITSLRGPAIGPSAISPQSGGSGNMVPRVYSPSLPSVGAMPRMDVGRSISPHSYAMPHGYGGGGGYGGYGGGSLNISRGVEAGGGFSHGGAGHGGGGHR